MLDAFVSAASSGALLWAQQAQGRAQICGGPTPAGLATDDIGRLFVMALRDHYGDAASAVAEREWKLDLEPRRLLPARTVRRAVACAESALSLLMAQSKFLQFEFSAVLMGWRFRRVAETLGLDPAALAPERRQALDQALEGDFRSPLPVDTDAVTVRLQALLAQSVH